MQSLELNPSVTLGYLFKRHG